MESALIDTIFLSEKRKNLLLLLVDGPKNADEIKQSLDVSWRSMIPQIKKLKEHDLIVQDNKTYCLSSVGKLIVENMRPLLNTVKVIEIDTDYWIGRDLDTIPEDLAVRIGELGDCVLVEPDLDYMFELPPEFMDYIKSAKHFISCASYFHPAYPDLYSKLVDGGVDISLIMSESVLGRMEQDCSEELHKLMVSEKASVYVCGEDIRPPTFIITDRAMLISFFNSEGRYDHKSIISSTPGALQWGNELFQYYSSISENVHGDQD